MPGKAPDESDTDSSSSDESSSSVTAHCTVLFAIGKIHQGTLVSKKMLGGLAVMNALAGIIEPVKEQQKWTL